MKKSAGILAYKWKENKLEFLLVHPGGPFWKRKDDGSWSIPKGEFSEGENAFTTAKREFEEELGQAISGDFMELQAIKQKSGKMVYAWAVNADIDVSTFKSNLFEMEWPPKSGRVQQFPEIDKAEWLEEKTAKQKINPAQAKLIEELMERVHKEHEIKTL